MSEDWVEHFKSAFFVATVVPMVILAVVAAVLVALAKPMLYVYLAGGAVVFFGIPALIATWRMRRR